MKSIILNICISALLFTCVISCKGQSKFISEELTVENSLGKTCIINQKGDTIPFTGVVYDSTDEKVIYYYTIQQGLSAGDKSYFRSNGKLQSSTEYKNGMKNGEDKKYLENGNLKRNWKYLDDMLNGKSIDFDELGRKTDEINYLNDKYDGEWINYYSNGKVKTISNYKNGLLDGPCLFFYENGSKETEGNFVLGEEDGEWTWYEKDGTIDTKTLYKNGAYYKKCDCCNAEYLSDEGWGISKEFSFNVTVVAKRVKDGNYCSEGCAQKCGLN